MTHVKMPNDPISEPRHETWTEPGAAQSRPSWRRFLPVVMAVMLAVAGAFIVYQLHHAGNLRDGIVTVAAERDDLRGDVETLTAERDELRDDVETLEEQRSEANAAAVDCRGTAEAATQVVALWLELAALDDAWLRAPEGSQEEADIEAKSDEQFWSIRDASIGLGALADSCLGSGSLDDIDVAKAVAREF